jgi:TRAP-type mannitol/chloroaromatic compound transport system substrate-binding protein
MKRRQFLGAATAGLATAAVASPAIAQSAPEVKWRLTSSFPKSLDTLYGAADVFSKAVAEATDQKFQIQNFAAGEIVPGLQAADAVQNGTVEMCHTASYFYKKYNFMALMCGNTNCQMGGWFRKEIKEVADLDGLKFRIAGFAGQILSKLGVVPQQVAGGDIYPALEKGTIDAAEWVGPYDDEKLGFNKVAKFYYYPGWWEGGAMLHNFINLEKWNALPKNYQQILKSASDTAHNWMMSKYDAGNPAALKRLVAGGAQLRPFPQAVMEASYKATTDTYNEVSAKNAEFKKVYDSMVAFRGDQYLWWQVAELGFDSFMVRMRSRS